MWIILHFDSRGGSRVRERIHVDAHVNGPGSLIEMDIIRRIGGYDTVTMCEDTEFNFKRMFEKIKPHFVEDAVVYEDLPSTLKDFITITIPTNNITVLMHIFLSIFLVLSIVTSLFIFYSFLSYVYQHFSFVISKL